MAENGTPFVPTPKQKGDYILADDWNITVNEIARLGRELDARADDTFDNDLSITGALGVGTAAPGAKVDIVGAGGTDIDLRVNGRLRSDNPNGGLWIANDRLIGGHRGNQLGLFNGNKWRLTVQPDGNVGIGTPEPTTKLDVNGTIKASQYEGDGSKLTGIDALSQTGGTVSGALTVKDAISVDGTVTATKFEGDGSALTGIDALSHAGGILTGDLTVEGTVMATKFEGDGSALTGIDALSLAGGTLTGALTVEGGLTVNGEDGLTVTESISAKSVTAERFAGDGSALTNLNALGLAGGALSGPLSVTGAVTATEFVGDGAKADGLCQMAGERRWNRYRLQR